jgi:hypothetical protein
MVTVPPPDESMVQAKSSDQLAQEIVDAVIVGLRRKRRGIVGFSDDGIRIEVTDPGVVRILTFSPHGHTRYCAVYDAYDAYDAFKRQGGYVISPNDLRPQEGCRMWVRRAQS